MADVVWDYNKLIVLIFSCFVACTLVFIVRIYWVLIRKKDFFPEKVKRSVKTMVVAGSGTVYISMTRQSYSLDWLEELSIYKIRPVMYKHNTVKD